MANTEVTTRELNAEAYIETANSLVAEIERALAAITRNDLGDLEESLSEQRAMAARLEGLRHASCTVRSNRTVTAGTVREQQLSLDRSLTDARLQIVTRVYKALVQHSSHSTSLMAALLDSSRGQFKEASGPRLNYQTWSCQM